MRGLEGLAGSGVEVEAELALLDAPAADEGIAGDAGGAVELSEREHRALRAALRRAGHVEVELADAPGPVGGVVEREQTEGDIGGVGVAVDGEVLGADARAGGADR